MKYFLNGISSIFLLLLVSGCSRYAGWVQEVFYQGNRVPTFLPSTKKYVRSLHVYDYLTTLAHFDALWLSDDIRTIYVGLQAQNSCLNTCQKEALCTRECAKNDTKTTFIILAWVKGATNTELTDECPLWSMCLSVDCKCYQPCSIKICDLCPEYVAMFGRIFTRFKTAYVVQFDIGQDALEDAGSFELRFNKIGLQTSVSWCLDSAGIPYTDSFDKNILMYDVK